jgi:hypothetical protein
MLEMGASAAGQREVVMPRARSAELVVTELDGEQLVYDLRDQKMHHLNRTSKLVWQYCDGTTTVGQVLDILSAEDGRTRGEVLWLALGQLQDARLLSEATDHVAARSSYSRRTLLKKGLITGAVALPVISSLVAPTAAAAVSVGCKVNNVTCVCTGKTCTTNAECCSGTCQTGNCCIPNGQVNATCATNSDCCSNNCDVHNKCVAKP